MLTISSMSPLPISKSARVVASDSLSPSKRRVGLFLLLGTEMPALLINLLISSPEVIELTTRNVYSWAADLIVNLSLSVCSLASDNRDGDRRSCELGGGGGHGVCNLRRGGSVVELQAIMSADFHIFSSSGDVEG